MNLRPPARAAAALLALALLLGGMPLTLGATAQRHGPMFTLNICNPLHSFDRSPVPVLAVMTEHPSMREPLPECELSVACARTLHPRAADAPDPPPPKARA